MELNEIGITHHAEVEEMADNNIPSVSSMNINFDLIWKLLQAIGFVGVLLIGYGQRNANSDFAKVQMQDLQATVKDQGAQIATLSAKVAGLDAKIEMLVSTLNQQNRFKESSKQ